MNHEIAIALLIISTSLALLPIFSLFVGGLIHTYFDRKEKFYIKVIDHLVANPLNIKKPTNTEGA